MAGQKEKLNRADSIRRRRADAADETAAPKSQRSPDSAVLHSAPVFVRQGVIGTSVVQRTRTQVKRKVAVPLRDGAEVIIPGLPILRFGWRLASGILALAMAILIGLVAGTDLFNTSAISINGLRRVSAADVASVLNLGGIPAYMLDPNDILLDIETSFPEFYNVSVDVTYPAVVNIALQERDPVIAWQYDTITLWVDAQGNVFTPRGEAEGLITVKSSVAPPRIQVLMTDREIQIARELGHLEQEDEVMMKDGPVDPELVKQILYLADQNPEIASLSYNPKNGYGWHDDNRDWNIFFGPTLDNLDQKLLLYSAIKDSVLVTGISIEAISVACTQAPFSLLQR